MTTAGRWRTAACLLLAASALRAHRRLRQRAYVRGALAVLDSIDRSDRA